MLCFAFCFVIFTKFYNAQLRRLRVLRLIAWVQIAAQVLISDINLENAYLWWFSYPSVKYI